MPRGSGAGAGGARGLPFRFATAPPPIAPPGAAPRTPLGTPLALLPIDVPALPLDNLPPVDVSVGVPGLGLAEAQGQAPPVDNLARLPNLNLDPVQAQHPLAGNLARVPVSSSAAAEAPPGMAPQKNPPLSPPPGLLGPSRAPENVVRRPSFPPVGGMPPWFPVFPLVAPADDDIERDGFHMFE